MHGFDVGPLNISLEKLQETTKNIAGNVYLGGGGWGVVKARSGKGCEANAHRGEVVTFGCHHRGAKGKEACQCSWEITYEWSTEGWMVTKYHGGHTKPTEGSVPPVAAHTLKTSTAEVMAGSSGRFIPEDLLPLASVCQKAGFSPIQTFEALKAQSEINGVRVSFLYTRTSFVDFRSQLRKEMWMLMV